MARQVISSVKAFGYTTIIKVLRIGEGKGDKTACDEGYSVDSTSLSIADKD